MWSSLPPAMGSASDGSARPQRQGLPAVPRLPAFIPTAVTQEHMQEVSAQSLNKAHLSLENVPSTEHVMCVCVYVWVCVCVSVCICVYIGRCMCTCVYVCMCMGMCIHSFTHIYMSIHTITGIWIQYNLCWQRKTFQRLNWYVHSCIAWAITLSCIVLMVSSLSLSLLPQSHTHTHTQTHPEDNH